jgi:hypothetical protein
MSFRLLLVPDMRMATTYRLDVLVQLDDVVGELRHEGLHRVAHCPQLLEGNVLVLLMASPNPEAGTVLSSTAPQPISPEAFRCENRVQGGCQMARS